MAVLQNRRKQLSTTEASMLDVIAKFPGLTPIELVKHLPNMKPAAASGCASRLVWMRKVNRTKVPMSSSFRYYPKDAQLPKGFTEWSNTLIKVVKRTRKGNGPDVPATNDLFSVSKDLTQLLKQQKEQRESEQPSDKVSLRTNDVLITIPIGERESMTVTVEQARKIWVQLNAIFGEK